MRLLCFFLSSLSSQGLINFGAFSSWWVAFDIWVTFVPEVQRGISGCPSAVVLSDDLRVVF